MGNPPGYNGAGDESAVIDPREQGHNRRFFPERAMGAGQGVVRGKEKPHAGPEHHRSDHKKGRGNDARDQEDAQREKRV